MKLQWISRWNPKLQYKFDLGVSQRKDKKLHFKIELKQALNSISLEHLTLMHQYGDKISRTKDSTKITELKKCLNSLSLKASNCKKLIILKQTCWEVLVWRVLISHFTKSFQYKNFSA